MTESACLRVSVRVCGGVSEFLSGVGDMLQFFLCVFERITASGSIHVLERNMLPFVLSLVILFFFCLTCQSFQSI